MTLENIGFCQLLGEGFNMISKKYDWGWGELECNKMHRFSGTYNGDWFRINNKLHRLYGYDVDKEWFVNDKDLDEFKKGW